MNFYFNYADFVWTKHLLSYDDSQRKNFIEKINELEKIKLPAISCFLLNLLKKT